MAVLKVAGRDFQWFVECVVDNYEALLYYPGGDVIDVLRIEQIGSDFSVAIRVDSSSSYFDGAIRRSLGPMLIVGQSFVVPNNAVAQGFLLELRPKVRRLKDAEPDSSTVERVMQWCLGSHFYARRVNARGGEWVGYGNQPTKT